MNAEAATFGELLARRRRPSRRFLRWVREARGCAGEWVSENRDCGGALTFRRYVPRRLLPVCWRCEDILNAVQRVLSAIVCAVALSRWHAPAPDGWVDR